MLENASLSSLRGWNLQFSGWRLIWKMGVEHKCFFKMMMTIMMFLKQFSVIFFLFIRVH